MLFGIAPARVVGPTLPLDTWTMVTGAYDWAEKQIRLYLNGELAAVVTVTGSRTNGTNPMVFGSSIAAQRFQGQMDEVRYYNALLTESQRLNLYNQQQPYRPHSHWRLILQRALLTPTRTNTPTFTPTRTLTPTRTPTGWAQTSGVLNMAAGATFNINMNNTIPHTCTDGGDGVAYSVKTLAASYTVLSVTPSTGCLAQATKCY